MDLAVLRSWLDEQGIGSGPLTDVRPLSGGTQNVLVALVRSGRRYVLRRPPVQKRPRSDETIRREARVLAALAGSEVPHARLVAVCAETEPLGAAFFVTEYVDGFSPWDGLPDPYADDLAVQHRLGLAVADAFAALARIDIEAAGLHDLGRTERWAERQPDRWRTQLRSYAELDGDGEGRLPGADVVHAWLEKSCPPMFTPGLMHGDAHLGNILVRRDGLGVAAIVDWELATVGDPMLDLGQLLATWPVEGSVYAARVTAPGLPGPAELADRWAASAGRSLDSLGWFHVLACFRLAVLLEGSQARAGAGQGPVETGRILHDRALGLVQQARAASGT